MIIEYVDIVNLIKDEREEYEYIYKAFSCNNINYLMFFNRYKHLFNIDLDHLSVPLILILIRKMVDNGMICDKQKCE